MGTAVVSIFFFFFWDVWLCFLLGSLFSRIKELDSSSALLMKKGGSTDTRPFIVQSHCCSYRYKPTGYVCIFLVIKALSLFALFSPLIYLQGTQED